MRFEFKYGNEKPKSEQYIHFIGSVSHECYIDTVLHYNIICHDLLVDIHKISKTNSGINLEIPDKYLI